MNDRRNVLQESLAAIQRLQGRLDAAEAAPHEPIAIVGMACRLPGGVTDTAGFWKVLSEEMDMVGEVPADRWDVDAYYDPDPNAQGKSNTKAGGFLKDIEAFEPSFFGISPREAAGLDPQQRLLLEVAWEALEDGGIAPDSLDSTLTGVFVGITSMDYSQRIDVADPARSDIYLATGTALNAAAGRVSFTLGLQGPCMAIDTACSSSLVAIHTACQSLRNGESHLAMAGGVNAIMSPDPFVLISKWGMLSPDGRCKTFDASANGFVRGEGCGLIVLERLSNALAHKRNILAVIRGSAINQDGHSSGLTVPNGLAQQAVVRQALAAARLAPTDVSYVEAHGTGTALGDPIEVEALAAVYGEGRNAGQPFEVGSAKSNIGHLEAASGVTGMLKLVLALQHRQLPASLHVRTPTPAIPWERLPVRISTRLHEWIPYDGAPRRAGVSAFGFSGMNAHAILEEAPAVSDPVASPPRPLFLLPLSGRSEEALFESARLYADHLERQGTITAAQLADICATAATGRTHFVHRAAFVAPDAAGIVTQLRALADSGTRAAPPEAIHDQAAARVRTGFLFTGQGAQYVGMGRELYDTEPVFRAALDRCAAVLDPLLAQPLLRLLFEDTGGQLDQTGNTQPALYALQVSLAALWQSWGIVPIAVIGHSVGEFAAAAVAGVFSIEDGARLIAARGRLMQALPTGGVMVSLQGDAKVLDREVGREVAANAGEISVAARNAPGNLVISGARAPVEAIATRLAAQGLRTQPLTVSHAFHSPLMEPMLEEFRRIAASVEHSTPQLTWISNVDGRAIDWDSWGHRMPDYWCRHVREPVAFEDGVRALAERGPEACIEVGPHPTLIGLAQQTLETTVIGTRTVSWHPSLRRGTSSVEVIVDSVARLYVRGGRIDWAAFTRRAERRVVRLPTTPFQRQRFLIDYRRPSRRPLGKVVHELLGTRIPVAGVTAQFESAVSVDEPAWLADHRIGGEVLMPLTGYLEIALAAARQVHGPAVASLDDLEVGEPLVLRDGETRLLQVAVDEAGAGMSTRVRIFSRDAARDDAPWQAHAHAILTVPAAATPATSMTAALTEARARCTTIVDVPSFYDRLRALGVEFGPRFRAMRSVAMGLGEAIGEIEAAAAVAADGEQKFIFHPALLDACFHVSAVAMDSLPGADDGRMYLPIGVDRVRWHGAPSGRLVSHAQVRAPQVRGDMLTIDIRIADEAGALVAELDGLRCRRASRDMFRQRLDAQVAEWLYEISWRPRALVACGNERALQGHWLVLDEAQGRGERLAAEIGLRGGRAIRVIAGPGPSTATPDVVEIDPAAAAGYAQLFTPESPPVAGVVCLWPLAVPTLRDEDDLPSTVQRLGTDAALLLLQAIAATGQHIPLWFVTAGAEAVDGTETPRIEQAPVAGFARVAAIELPEHRITHVDLDPQAAPTSTVDARQLADELTQAAAPAPAGGHESRIALRKGLRYVARLARKPRCTSAPTDEAPTRLHIQDRGTLENLAIVPGQRRAPGPGEIEIRVRASGLNFRDVLSALGLYPGEIKHLGSDCAGEIVALGSEVRGFGIGDRVVAMTEGAFASHATTRWEFVAPLPAGLDFELGAAIPTAYLTADITLNEIARIKQGDRVLIHSGAGGVGMAAIALAKRVGAEIFATAGNPDKRAVLARLGVHHVLDSRSPAFADEVMRITGGAGVDIVLNSLTGAMLDRSFEVLAEGGTFLEIGKRNLWTHEQAAELNRGIRYHIVDCNDNARDTPAIVGRIFTRVLREIEAGLLPILPCTTFAFEQAPDAFRYMAQARHIGRVVFRHAVVLRRTERPVRDDATYLVTGGLQGLGLLAARWLADEGARHLLLAARSPPDARARETIARLEADGVRVTTVAADVGSAPGVGALMQALQSTGAPLGGVLHGAAVLDDGVLMRQTRDRFAAVLAPKADGAWRLHRALVKRGLKPDFFVMYSSMSAVLGSPGQGNYVAANAFLDALARYRVLHDEAACSIAWGAWKDVGMAARGTTAERASAMGLSALTPAQGLHALGLVLREGFAHVAVTAVEWPQLLRQLDAGSPPPIWQDLVAQARTATAHSGSTKAQVVDYAALPAVERFVQLVTLVRRELATVLALPDGGRSLADDQAFGALGLDSLTAIELRNRLQAAVGRPVAAMAAFEFPTVEALAAQLASLFVNAEDADHNREEVTL